MASQHWKAAEIAVLIALLSIIPLALTREIASKAAVSLSRPTGAVIKQPTTTAKPKAAPMKPKIPSQKPAYMPNLMPPSIVKTTTTTTPEPEPGPSDKFYIKNQQNAYCFLAAFSAVFSIQYKSYKDNKLKTARIEMPYNVSWNEDRGCSPGTAQLAVSWPPGINNYAFAMTFDKGSCSDIIDVPDKKDGCWFMTQLVFTYNSSDPTEFQAAADGGPHISTYNNTALFETPINYSYTCRKGAIIPLSSEETEQKTVLQLTGLQLQPFGVKSQEFGKGYPCASESMTDKTANDNTAAIATGSILAIVTLSVIVGYWARRTYFDKIKYQTMS